MPDSSIDGIVADICRDHPELASKEAEIRSLVSALVEAKPEVLLDSGFKDQLWEKLRADLPDANLPARIPVWRLATGLGLAALAFAGGIAAYQYVRPADGPSVAQKGSNAFGPLVSLGASGGGIRSAAEGTALSAPEGQAPAADMSSAGSAGSSLVYPARYTRYVYGGPAVSQADARVDVLKRAAGAPDENSLKGEIKSMLSGDFLKGASVTRVSLSKGDESYAIDIDFSTAAVSVLLNGGQSISAGGGSTSDQEAISFANAFIDSVGFDRSRYGSPTAERAEVWAFDASSTSSSSPKAASGPFSVLYPLVVDGKKVYELGGTVAGMRVSIDPSSRKATAIYGYQFGGFESSSYEAETDGDAIVEYAEKQGGWEGVNLPEGGSFTDVPLGAPERAYVRMYRHEGGKSEEFLVPALAFPLSEPNGFTAVSAVPLAKDLLRSTENVVAPMPAIMDGGAEPALK